MERSILGRELIVQVL